MVDPAYIEYVRSMQQKSEPLICQFLVQLSEAWDLPSSIRTISTQFYDYGWYVQARGLSIVMAINYHGRYPTSHTWWLEVGKLAYTKPPLNIYRTLISFPLSARGFAEAMDWMNDHGPQYFYE
jgi:hypothetical protein